MLYFVPDKQTITPKQVNALGLGYAMGKSGPSYAAMSTGPGGKPGVVFSFTQSNLSRAGKVKWEQHYAFPPKPSNDSEIFHPGIWLGLDLGKEDKPADYERAESLDGHRVLLADGNEWLIPVARWVDGSSPLPRSLKPSPSGGWVEGEVIAQHRDLYEQATRIWDALTEADEGEKVTLDDGRGVSALALAANYRIGPAEIGVLGLLTTANEFEILYSLVDWQTFLDYVKKKLQESETVTCAPGGAA